MAQPNANGFQVESGAEGLGYLITGGEGGILSTTESKGLR
jgi:hypothetical protein